MSEKNTEKNDLMEKIVSLCKRRGFVFQGSEIYGGLAGTFDWGHHGVALKNNIKQNWWKKFVDSRRDMYGVDAAILMNSKVWEASGHVAGFADPVVECKKCGSRFRADQVINDQKDFLREKEEWGVLGKKIIEEVEKENTDIEKFLHKVMPVYKELSPEEQESFKTAIQPTVEKKHSQIKNVKEKLERLNFLIEEMDKSQKYIGFVVQYYLNKYVLCPNNNCKAHNSWSSPRMFNMMFATKIGAMEDSASTVYLRPETAQGIFVNFKNTVDAFHPKLPFGIAQIGKAFRNEITPRDFIFRVRELEAMEVEYFIRSEDWEKYFEYWQNEMNDWMKEIGIDMSRVHELEVADEDRAHYSKRTVDFEFDFPFGRKELFGLAYRTNFDLTNHGLEYVDEERGEKIVPHVIEPALGVDRAILALLLSSYTTDEKGGEVREYLKFKPNIAPVICAVSPLLKNKSELVAKAQEVFDVLKAEFGRVAWDDNGNIGKRYRRQDEIGTPFCIVIDFDTLTDDTVTVRDRDSGEQERIKIEDLKKYIKEKI